jgi:hypothetical protein
MNCRYFGCKRCKTYVDAGYRWAYWQLEHSGIVALASPVDPRNILAAESYWNPLAEERSDWLCNRVLPSVRRFLLEHGDHGLVYFEEDSLAIPEAGFEGWNEASNA